MASLSLRSESSLPLSSRRTSRESIQDFLDRFAQALTQGDVDAFVGLWNVPALKVSNTSVTVVDSIEMIELIFSAIKEQYDERGVADTHGDIIRQYTTSEDVFIVEVNWPYLDAKGNQIGGETATYTLRRDRTGDFKLCVATRHRAWT